MFNTHTTKLSQKYTFIVNMTTTDITVTIIFGILGVTIGIVQIVLQWRAINIARSKRAIAFGGSDTNKFNRRRRIRTRSTPSPVALTAAESFIRLDTKISMSSNCPDRPTGQYLD